MALFEIDQRSTRVPTGVYGYDIAAEDTAQQLGQARRQADLRPVEGAGGISGSALRQRGEMEGAFMDASIRAIQQRRAQEMARRRQEAGIREQRRNMVKRQQAENFSRLVSGVAAMGQDFGAQVGSIAKRRMTPEGIGDAAMVQDQLDRGLIRSIGGTEEDPLYGYTFKGGAQQLFSDPYWGVPARREG